MDTKELFSLFKKDVIYLLSYEPFYANILTDLNRSFTTDVPFAGVSIKDNNYILYLNPNTYFSLPINQRMFILIHELLHIILEHLFEMENKNLTVWNYATDICINQMIQNNIATPPTFVLTINSFKKQGLSLAPNLSSFEYYDILIKHLGSDFKDNSSSSNNGSSSNSDNDSSKSESTPSNSSDKNDNFDFNNEEINHNSWKKSDELSVSSETLKQKMKELVKNASEIAGNKTPSIFRDFVKPNTFSETPWNLIFRRIVANKTSSSIKRTWKKPHRHFKDAAMGKKKKKKHFVYVIIDTSASIKDNFLKDFYIELNNLIKLDSDIIIIECDSQIQSIYKYKKNTNLSFKGGGGTNFIPAFDAILNKEDSLLKTKPNLVICLTDGMGLAPDYFKYKTVFCLTENGKKPYSRLEDSISWGYSVKMNKN